MEGLLIIDMQVGCFEPVPRHDAAAVTERIARIAEVMREHGRPVLWVQHEEPAGAFLRHSPGWAIVPELIPDPQDRKIRKTACDSFYRTDLEALLHDLEVDDLLVCGCCTDFCVDTTIRAAASRDFDLTVLTDAHTTADRPHMEAVTIIEHHHSVWRELTAPGARIELRTTAEAIAALRG